jgi:hypothetical protein
MGRSFETSRGRKKPPQREPAPMKRHRPESSYVPDHAAWKESHAMNTTDVIARRKAPLDTPTDLTPNATKDISGALNIRLADMFALYLKTKNFHWHVSCPHFRDYHLLVLAQK